MREQGHGSADQRLCFHYTDSTIPLLLTRGVQKVRGKVLPNL